MSEARSSVRAVDVPEIQCECRMRELQAAGYGPEAYLRIITGQIGRIGWAVQGVPGDEQWPSWAYSIGLWHTFRVPELALFGVSLPNMAAIINALGRRIADGGTIAADDRIDGVCPLHVRDPPRPRQLAGNQPVRRVRHHLRLPQAGLPADHLAGPAGRPPVGTEARGPVRWPPPAT